MGDVVMKIEVPLELYAKLEEISHRFKSDLNADLVSLMECYVDMYRQISLDPAARMVLMKK